jgi:EAL domain-containing protein (putative c-di-GMP-specific phosphodiesterase class I)/ActR/RegA family two-component response regulator
MHSTAPRILVLDDEHFMLKLVARMLGDLGLHAVRTCDNGSAALDLLEDPETAPDLILLDLIMPDMDGIEFVRKLVERRFTGSLILVSGEDERMLQMAERLVHAHAIPVLGYLRKPVSLVDLGMLVKTWTPNPRQRDQATEKTYSASEVAAAIANGELVNFYQPKVDIAEGAVVGVETLVRWRHPADGLVLPDQLISVAEAHGLIDALTHVVLAEAIAQAKAWRDAGLQLRIAVNVSMDNLASVAFADQVSREAAAAGVPPQDIVLELTESRLMLDQRAPLESLTRLRMKRFRLSIDDFGTGHSSLTQLGEIPFDELKIDRSFVHGALHDATRQAIYAASLGLGRQLHMEVVAEGVEDADDWQLVRKTGCDVAQGFFLAHAMPAAELPGWIASWNANRDAWRATPT